MKFQLTYTHTRNLFKRTEFKPFVNKYFKDVKFEGCSSGNWEPSITISNWEEVKNELPKYAIPISVNLIFDGGILDALVNGHLGIARTIIGENDMVLRTRREYK